LFKISIIIPTINEANNLPLLLSDLLTTYKEGEIIIVDCGSEDRTIDVANIYGAKVYLSKEKLIIINKTFWFIWVGVAK